MTKRILKVYEQYSGNSPFPTIILKGKWLQDAGFKAGEYVEVIASGDEIKLKKTDEPVKPDADLIKMSKEELIKKIKELEKK